MSAGAQRTFSKPVGEEPLEHAEEELVADAILNGKPDGPDESKVSPFHAWAHAHGGESLQNPSKQAQAAKGIEKNERGGRDSNPRPPA